MSAFALFLHERKFLKDVSPHTLRWYKHAFKWLPSESPTEPELKAMVIRMREQGLKPTGCNAALRAINAYLKWSESGLKIPKLREPQLVMPTFTDVQVQKLIHWRPTTFFDHRLHLLVLLLLDTGCRISEVLNLQVQDIDLDNLLLLVNGKGKKQRRIPFSFELRKTLFKYTQEHDRKADNWLLATKDGRHRLSRNIMLRNVRELCQRLGFKPPPRTLHALRHTFAINYLRRGGNVLYLQKVLGHSTLEMTRRYCHLLTEDLQLMHQRVSLLH